MIYSLFFQEIWRGYAPWENAGMQDFWSPLKEIIQQLCLDFDKRWQLRKRVIDTRFLVLFTLKLVLSKNTQGYNSLLNELWESEEISGYQQKPIAASSLCEARQKMPATIFTELNRAILSKQEQSCPLPRWCGHRVFAVDGSKVNLPHELLSDGYKAPNKNQHYPQGLMSTVYHLGSGLIYDCLLRALTIVSPKPYRIAPSGCDFLIVDQRVVVSRPLPVL